ncbi:uncharacterized protein PHACADRAFT_265931 [Phanerochaete carnosa HHB-10118-sp]|uniref:Uncharacterized protein n=1 Tax=Phanerochaete carnosa (strain HHB-10118-sp) TaxID=650164 RepID=K5VQG1_PHACS|nr:uncharacterized protein PHACADRAFT_265931 [Phanerochaete carnosa HHB-10118-sp]EKM48975.1 hypothetical protein PHACADRAFT_265931 [Phanerochaete carnosa HHB-10118-sp]
MEEVEGQKNGIGLAYNALVSGGMLFHSNTPSESLDSSRAFCGSCEEVELCDLPGMDWQNVSSVEKVISVIPDCSRTLHTTAGAVSGRQRTAPEVLKPSDCRP